MLSLYAATFWVSAATLLLELTLTRLFSVSQWYHFAFMSVSVALLGFGASGTWLTLRPFRPGGRHLDGKQTPGDLGKAGDALRSCLSSVAMGFSVSILVAYIAINYVPFDSYQIGWEPRQLVYLVLYYSAMILPFFFAGLFSALCLGISERLTSTVYAANLLGSASGSLAVLALVPQLGAARAVAASSFMGLLASLILQGSRPSAQGRLRAALARPANCALLLSLGLLLIRPPSWFTLRLSPYKTLSGSLLLPEARTVFSRWNAFSRVDVVQADAIHSAPGLSLSFKGQLPQQLALLVDGGNLSPILCVKGPSDQLFLQHLTTALPFQMRPDASALVIEPRGGLDIWAALGNGSQTVVAVESNSLVVEAVRQQAVRCAPSVYDDPRVRAVVEDARSYLRRAPDRFDIVLVSLSDTYQPVMSGAYGLSESYIHTTEAFVDLLAHLRDDGILVVTRWLQSPPSEELRAFVLLTEALQRLVAGDPSRHVVALRSWSTATMLAKLTPFSGPEVERLKAFCAENSFDLIYYQGMKEGEANQFNVLTDSSHYALFRRALDSSKREALLRIYPYEVSPPGDDRPFFYHHFRWVQVPGILSELGRNWQPFGGSGFLVLVALLAVATLLSMLLILLPLTVRAGSASRDGRSDRAHRGPIMAYFACLGAGFLLVEMPLLQRFILFLGQPTYSFALVLFSILLFSGLGSLLSPKVPLRPVLLILSVWILVYPSILTRLLAAAIHASLPLRLVVTVVGLAPLGLPLGIPLAAGIRLVGRHDARLIPWAWAVNGCASVVGSISAVMGALSLGFSRVLALGGLAYALAWLVVPSLSGPEPPEGR